MCSTRYTIQNKYDKFCFFMTQERSFDGYAILLLCEILEPSEYSPYLARFDCHPCLEKLAWRQALR